MVLAVLPTHRIFR